jgi:CheY-like chemotaxis protein
MRILVVEDEPRMAELLRQGLLDVTLPGMDGFTIARRLRTGHNQIPILMLTARDGPPRADSAAAAFPGRGLEHESRHAGRPARQAANRLDADGGMMGKSSIRLRLTIWYSVVLLSGLVLFAVGMWFALEQHLTAGVDSRLTQRVQGLQTVFSTEGGTKDRRQLQEEVSEFAGVVPDGVLIQLRDAAGTLVLPSPDQPPFSSGPASTQPESWTVDRNGRSFRIRTVRMDYGGRPYDVLLAGPLDEVRAAMRAFRNLLLLMIPGVLAAACLGGYWISRRALAPVDEITRVAKSISVQNLSERLSVPRTGDELQRMSETWNQVLERLDATVKRIRQFTADASHELRTPVALIRATAELALRREREPEEYRKLLRDIESEAQRMTELTESLLTLARADASGLDMPLVKTDLNVVVHDAVRQSAPLAEAQGLLLKAETAGVPALASANEAGTRRLLLILIDNALKHKPGAGARFSLTLRT